MVSYVPKHNHPVTQEELNRLEPEILTNEISRLQHSIEHLVRSNRELDDFTSEEGLEQDDVNEFVESIKENEQTIASQNERLHMIRLALSSKLGVDAANAHYHLATATPVPSSLPPAADLPAPAPAPPSGPRWADDEDMQVDRSAGEEMGARGDETAAGRTGGEGSAGQEGVVDEADGGVYL